MQIWPGLTIDVIDSRGVEAAREGPCLTIGRRRWACSRRERENHLITQATLNISGNLLELDDRQMLSAFVVADHEDDFLAWLTIDGR